MAEKLQIIIDADDKATKEIGNVNGALRGLGTTAGKVAVAGIAAASVAVVTLGAAMGKLAFDAMPIEGIQNAFKGLTKDSDKTMVALRRGSQGMVKDAQLMETYNNAFQLVGENFAETLPDAMGYLGKVSAATGQDMGFLMNSLTTGIGRLSPMILDNLAIQVDLTSATEAYAESIGKPVAELTKAEQQTALMNQVMEKLAKNTKDMPDITENAATKWAQLQTTFGNLKDEIGLALLPAFGSVLGWMNDFLPPAIDFAKEKFGEIISKWGEVKTAFETGGMAQVGADLIAPTWTDWSAQLDASTEATQTWLDDPKTKEDLDKIGADMAQLLVDGFIGFFTGDEADGEGEASIGGSLLGSVRRNIAAKSDAFSFQGGEIADDLVEGVLDRAGYSLDSNQKDALNTNMKTLFGAINPVELASFVWGQISQGLFGLIYGSVSAGEWIQSHADGGIVAGAMGSPQPILAHGGEMVLNPQQQQQLMFNLTVNSRAETSSVIQDFNMLKSMAGVA